MRRLDLIAMAMLTLAAGGAGAACKLKVGYTNLETPPYYLGSGPVEATPAGASVDLIREAAASVGCTVISVRLPPLRVPAALEAGTIDFAPLGAKAGEGLQIAYPLDNDGQPDRERSMQMHTVVFVRKADGYAKDADAVRLLKGKKVGTTHGSAYAAALRQLGFDVDEGASNTLRNFDKLMLRRLDGFAVALVNPGDMDAVIAARYHGELMRFDKPIRSSQIWLPSSKAFYASQRETTEAIWAWIGSKGSIRFAQILKKYDTD